MDTIKRIYNWCRIKWHIFFTGKAETVIVKDERTGKDTEVTIERHVEEVCAHKKLKEITTTLWQCVDKPGCDVYFQINYKVMLTEKDLVKYMQDIASHLKSQLIPEDHA